MKTIKHTLKLETVLDEKSAVGSQLLSMPVSKRNKIINEMVNDLLLPRLQPVLDELNENGSYAILKVRQ
jgi:hypothetical protein